MKKILLGALLSFLPVIAFSGPFGFSNDSTPSGAHCLQTDDPMWYRCDSAPKAHSDFDFYLIQYHSDVGVCFLKAVGKDIKANSFGTQLTAQMDKIKNQISSKYGSPNGDVDEPRLGSIWTDPEDFMTSILKKERFIFTDWKVDASKHGFDQIAMTIKAIVSDEGYVVVEYYYPASDKCDEIVNESEASSF